MNILYVITTLHKGGAEAHLLLLARGLQALGATCEVAFLRARVGGGSVDLREGFEAAGIRTHYLASEKSYDLRAGIRLHRLVKARKWDILHSHLPRADAAAAMCKILNRHQPWVSTLHHPYDNAYSGARLVPALARMWRLADGVIAVSEPVREWSINRLRLHACAVRTVVHGIPTEGVRVCHQSPAPVPLRYHIGSIGRYEERKGHETLIRAMQPILAEFPAAQLLIAGHDPWGHGAVLRKLVADLHLERHVHLIGFMSDKERFFNDIDVFAFASLSEGFGIVLLEAMAAGKPAVVSDIAPLRDIILPGRSGLVAERENAASFAEAILSLFRDPEYLRAVAFEGKRRVETEFSQARMVERTLQFYRDIVQQVRGEAS
jgi:glycosyltransferase involved in cell wall biosynthesis